MKHLTSRLMCLGLGFSLLMLSGCAHLPNTLEEIQGQPSTVISVPDTDAECVFGILHASATTQQLPAWAVPVVWYGNWDATEKTGRVFATSQSTFPILFLVKPTFNGTTINRTVVEHPGISRYDNLANAAISNANFNKCLKQKKEK
jgi:hypothetical protein